MRIKQRGSFIIFIAFCLIAFAVAKIMDHYGIDYKGFLQQERAKKPYTVDLKEYHDEKMLSDEPSKQP